MSITASREDEPPTVAPPSPPKVVTESQRTANAALDIAFCCDCTGSMGAYIRSAQENIRSIVTTLHAKKAGSCDVRFALVSYRDHPPQDRTYVTTVFPFTRQVEVMQTNVDSMSAQGGGDGPEAVAAALKEVSDLEWSTEASKVVVWIADAPPHGLGENGDGFPNGCPQGNDPIEIMRGMAGRGITLYALGVEPVLSSQYMFARDFMIAAAETMEGKFLPLGRAGALADVIVGTALEGLELEQLWQETEDALKREAVVRGERLSEADLVQKLEGRMKERAAKREVAHVEVENPYMDGRYDRRNVERIRRGMPRGGFRGGRGGFRGGRGGGRGGRGGGRGGGHDDHRRGCSDEDEDDGDDEDVLDPKVNAYVQAESSRFAWHAQAARVTRGPATEEQAERAYGRGMKRHRAGV